jgi:aspartyl protease family protein
MLHRLSRTAIPVALVLACQAGVPANAETIAERLRALATENGFTVQGFENVGDERAAAADDDPATALRGLLRGYDHAVESEAGRVRRVIVLGRKQERPAAHVVGTRRTGEHRLVDANLEGTPGRRARASLVVDTGASSVVLPESMMAALGFAREALPDRQSQTANGAVTGKAARLERVTVGGASAQHVEVLFIADERLGGVSLLGMSFLHRFVVTLPDEDGRLVLQPR